MKIKNILTKVLATTLAISVIGMSNITEAYAYDESDYDISEYGWQMDEYHGNTGHIDLIVLVQPNLTYKSTRGYYCFGCYADSLPKQCDGFAKFCRPFLVQGMEPFEDIENGNLYIVGMGVEPGKYCLSYPNARLCDENHILPLTQDLNTPFVGGGYYTAEDVRDENKEIVTIKDGDCVRVYMLYGSDDWRNSNAVQFEFKQWAKNYESTMNTHSLTSKMQIIDEKIVTEDGEEIEVPIEDIPTFVPHDGPTRVTSDIITTTEIPPEETEFPWWIVILGVVLAGCGGVYIFIKKRFE